MKDDDKINNAIKRAFKPLIRKDYESAIDDIPLFELGIDSLDFFEQMIYLEDDLGIQFSVEDLSHTVSINDLCKLVKN